jgi:hypothetical protein
MLKTWLLWAVLGESTNWQQIFLLWFAVKTIQFNGRPLCIFFNITTLIEVVWAGKTGHFKADKINAWADSNTTTNDKCNYVVQNVPASDNPFVFRLAKSVLLWEVSCCFLDNCVLYIWTKRSVLTLQPTYIAQAVCEYTTFSLMLCSDWAVCKLFYVNIFFQITRMIHWAL